MLTLATQGRRGPASSGAGSGLSLGRCSELVWTRQPEDWLERRPQAWGAARHLELWGHTDELEQRKPQRTYAGRPEMPRILEKIAPRDPQPC